MFRDQLDVFVMINHLHIASDILSSGMLWTCAVHAMIITNYILLGKKAFICFAWEGWWCWTTCLTQAFIFENINNGFVHSR